MADVMTLAPFILSFEGEEWKDVVGYEGAYMVSNMGRVVSIKRNGIKETHLMNPSLNDRYVYINLKNGKIRKTTLHRIIAEAFIPNPNNYPQIDHINGDAHDNRISNLRWVTPLENIRNPITLKRHNDKMSTLRNNNRSKKIIQKTKDGTLINEFPSIKEAVRVTGIDRANISAAANGKMRSIKGRKAHVLTAGGYVWQFV